MTKIKKLAVAMAVASVSSMASAALPLPPAAPTIYNGGPSAGNVASTNMSAQERAAYSLLESVMQLAEAKIHASGCTPLEARLAVFSGNAAPGAVSGTATLGVGSTAITLTATDDAAPTYQGQKFSVSSNTGEIGGKTTGGYVGKHAFNAANNLMVGVATTMASQSINGGTNAFQGTVIKDFYMGEPGVAGQYNLFDWGLQALDKGGFPVEKYWQRSKVRRSDGGNGQTAFVKDRLVGPSSCRIAIYMEGQNAPTSNNFNQVGTLKIQTVDPSALSTDELDKVDTL